MHVWPFACWRILLAFLLIFQNQHSQKILSEILSECQTVWIQIRPDILSGLIWVQIVCNGYKQRTQRVKSYSLTSLQCNTGPHSAVGNVSGNRYESDCRSSGRKFDPGPVLYFPGVWSWNIFYGHSVPSAESFKKGCCQLQAKVCAQSTG